MNQYYKDLWAKIHKDAIAADSDQKKADYCAWIHTLPTSIKCPRCRTHLMQYLQTNPPDPKGDLFLWSWTLHNSVSRRIGKVEFRYETAANIWGAPQLK